MSQPATLSRSPELMSVADTALLIVDVQEKLAPIVRDSQRTLWNVGRLLEGAGVLGVRTLATEQYPKGLGPTLPELANRLKVHPPEKLSFSCVGCSEFLQQLQAVPVRKVLLAGIETHVCVQQTALDLLAEGYRVLVAADAVSSRHSLDHDVALRRMEVSGAVVTTTEAALFEWCEVAGTPQFKQISQLVRQAAPGE